ncbi:MAG: acyl-CoA dehydrogenase family protein [Candidatus Binataceae bacterium]
MSISDSRKVETPTVEHAKALIPFLVEHSEINEAAGRILPETLSVLREAGLLHYLVPVCFGGGEASPLEALEIIETLAYADGSTAWAIMANQVATASAAAFLKPAAAQHIFGKRIPLIGGQGAPMGGAQVAPAGYRLTGNWGYGSGILHSEWLHTGATIFEDGQPRLLPGTNRPDTRIFILPMSQVQLKQNWDVLGLRATGSVDYSVDDVFVSEDFTHPITANAPYQGGGVYRVGLTGLAQFGHTAFALGIAKRALEEIGRLARAEKRPFNLAEKNGGESFQEQYGFHTAKLLAARSAEVSLCEEMERTTSAGDPLTVRQISHGVLITYMVHQVAFDIVKFAYVFGGGTSLRAGVLQRLYRDMSAGMQHAIVSASRIREATREIMGLYEGKIWHIGRLVDP